VIPNEYAKAFNILHDMTTDQLEEVYDHACTGNIPLLQIQVQYIIQMRERSGDRNDKRPWRKH